ncbi:AhpD family alkylhydroperoxidase [Pedobacter africanus]|uniref:AhpD family alkylhydroperoxidase n=1 Tax=Pedobacter africanus TaxID=151894 RepID=A0ACC6KVL9_9SPHI|nr:carboxymuconolactone decarboxylase family protein [Pedobacter africanus]MDR6783194.1 AhpD family alkylhydroperoxidase [Pedobacter africanus]
MERIKNSDVPQGLMAAMRGVQDYIDQCGFDPLLLDLMRVRVSQINGCAYCLDMHAKEALHAGETVQRLISVSAWREAPYYSPQERALLEFAELLTRMEETAEIDPVHEEMLKYFTKAEIANLTVAIAQINSWNRFVRSTGIVAGSYIVSK